MYVISLLPSRALRASSGALQVTQLLLYPRGIVGLHAPFVKTRFYKLSEGAWAGSVAPASLDPYSHFITMPDFLY